MELLSVPAIVAIVQALKIAGMPKVFAPLVSIALGMIFGVMFVSGDIMGIGAGLLIGLTASGLYSTGKHTIETLAK